tara:strand:- start:1396 stop:3810 length:2415 start_codon:yes stop_codon:yes gene_type:complete
MQSKMEDYLFRSPEGAIKKSKEIGFNGEIHESTLADGSKLYSPAKTEDEFIKWYRKNDPDAEEELGATVQALQYGKPKKNDPRKTPAKPSERRKGSKKNKKDSASKPNNSIKVSKETEARLRKMMTEHNKKVSSKGKGSKASMGRLKSVYRRGAGAFSRSHAPNMSRGGWGIARVKAFLYLLRNGRPSNPNYKQDNDLLPKSHPRASVDEEYEDWDNEAFTAAEYQGKKVTLNKPFRMPKGNSKKFGVYTKNDKGNVVIVRFGDPKMEIRRDDDDARRNYRSRMGCDTPRVGPKWKANYWSCKMWEKGKSVKDYTSSEFNKTDDTMETVMGGCGCGGECGSVEAAEPTPKDDETHDAYMSRCQEMGYSEEECMEAHKDHDFKEEVEGYGGGGSGGGGGYDNSCRTGYKMEGGKCVKATFQLDVEISVDDMVVQADTGEYIIAISGIAFHQGTNKNGWEITRAGANLAVSQMIGADLTLNHPKSENGRFTRNMTGGIDEAVVGFVTEATTVDKMGGNWEVRFKAEVHRKELFESLESGLWLREGYGVSIGGSGVPDEMMEAEDGRMIMKFETDFTFDHLAIVHRPAYSGAKIQSVEKVKMAESAESFNSHQESLPNIAKESLEMSDEEIIIASEEEVVVETPVAEETPTIDYAAEIEALKASLADRDAKLESIEAAEKAVAEEARLALVEKATELGIAGVADLPSETIETIMASFEAKMPVAEVASPVKEMTPVASNVEATVRTPVESEEVVANYLNRKLVKTPVSLYAKAWNAWAGAWNQTLSAAERNSSGAPTFEEARSKNLI